MKTFYCPSALNCMVYKEFRGEIDLLPTVIYQEENDGEYYCQALDFLKKEPKKRFERTPFQNIKEKIDDCALIKQLNLLENKK